MTSDVPWAKVTEGWATAAKVEVVNSRAIRSGRQAFSRATVLLGAAAILGVLLGLTAMHTIGLHGTSTHTPMTTSTQPAVHHETGSSLAGADPSGTTGADDCAGCPDGHAGMSMMMCIAVLLAVAISLLLLRPRIFRLWLAPAMSTLASFRPVTRDLSRAPSLHVLCISRT
jgi:hypothetical protein